jgi:polysaccharide biosynthesis/export protein
MQNWRGGRLILAAAAATAVSCATTATTATYVWADSLPEQSTVPAEYLLAPGDSIYVRVFNEDAISGRVRVRPDGRVTVPFVNDVVAAGQTTEQLAKAVQAKLTGLINKPIVTVSLEDTAPAQLSILGEVARPGVYPVDRGSQGVLRALAAAGGLTQFAHKDRIFVVRPGVPDRIRFTLEALSTPGSRSARFRLQNDDAILVQ